jgi:hypothetical protein
MTPITETLEPDTQALVERTEIIAKDFEGYQIVNNDAYAFAGEHLKKIKSLYSEVDAKRKSMTTPLDEAKKRIMDFFRVPLDKLTKVEGNIKGAMLTFQRQQEEIRRKEEARLQELARREEEKRKKALEERAKKAEAKGDLAKAEELLAKKEEAFVPAPIVESQVQKVEGVKTVKIWKFRVVNAAKIPRDYLCVDEKKIGAVAKATKGTLKIEGVEIYSEDVISSGRF